MLSASPGEWDGHPSPFDENGAQYAWDATSLTLLKECPRKYYYVMVANWQPKRKSHHLYFGQYLHSALETYDRLLADGADRETAIRGAIRRAITDSAGYEPGERKGTPDKRKTRENLIRCLVWYFEKYNPDPCRTIRLANGAPAVELSFRFDAGLGILLTGHLDRVAEFGDGVYVMDRKSTSSTVTGASAHYFFSGFNPDTQMTHYTLAGKVAYELPVRGVIIDAIQIGVETIEYGRDITHRSAAALDEYLENTYRWVSLAREFTAEDYWPMNESSCGNYGGCPFRSICALAPSNRERFLSTTFTQEGSAGTP